MSLQRSQHTCPPLQTNPCEDLSDNSKGDNVSQSIHNQGNDDKLTKNLPVPSGNEEGPEAARCESQLPQGADELGIGLGRFKTFEMDAEMQTQSSIDIFSDDEVIDSTEKSVDGEDSDANMNHDVYSIMLVSSLKSAAFTFAVAIFSIQMIALLFNLIDLFDTPRIPGNPLNIPPNVPWTVSASQAICLLISSATQQDFITSLAELHDGFRGVTAPAGVSIKHATQQKWFLSNICRFSQGFLSLSVSFFLIIQSDVVIDLYFNFAALTFIAELDNAAFWLVDNGYFFKRLQKQTSAVKKVAFIKRKEKRKLASLHSFRSLLIWTIYLAALIAWIAFFALQNVGHFLPPSIVVEFGDEFNQELGFFSGVYRLDRGFRGIGAKAEYVGNRFSDARFVYCSNHEAWAFTSQGGRKGCDEWKAQSPRTISYDISSVPSSEWSTRVKGTQSIAPFDFFSLTPTRRCRSIEDTNAEPCSGHGGCVERTGQCECKRGYFGTLCEFGPKHTCSQLEFFSGDVPMEDANNTGTDTNQTWGFQQIPGKSIFDRPVYAMKESEKAFGLLLFTGRRWIVTTSELLNGTSVEGNIEKLAEKTIVDFLSNIDNIDIAYNFVLYVSSIADSEESAESASPIGLRWFNSPDSSDLLFDTNNPADVSIQCMELNSTEALGADAS